MVHPLRDHLESPRGLGRLRDAPHSGAAGGNACGDLIRVSLRADGDRIAEAGFDADGCGALTAAGSATVELVEHAHVLDAAKLTPEAVADELGGLVPSKMHAASLAAEALHRALGTAALSLSLSLSPHRTLVAMSGGVDSAVAAQLALNRGDEVVAVTLELWADPATDGDRSCCSPQAVLGARALAHRMGIPHITLDLREPFRAQVVDDFVAGHAAGVTPNPCVRCNGLVRFEAMLELADALGAARLATGHYARIEDDGRGPLLRAAAYPGKDQTYMLSRLRPEQLARLWFPLGELTKRQVRELARAAGLPVAERPESQDLCFLAGRRRAEFLASSGGNGRPGSIVSLDGRVLGHHDGHHAFTVGQRRGLGVSSSEPLFVVRKDAATGDVTVGPRAALATSRVAVFDAELRRDASEVDRVKLRYRSQPVPCAAQDEGDGRLTLQLAREVDGVAPGQVACLLRDDRVLGWATIAGPADPRPAEPLREETANAA
jgi:tRNA-uridine 2-sulfurtransferase